MKVTTDTKALADAVRAVGKFLPARSGIASLAHYRIEAHSGIVAVTAFDMESGRRVEVEAEVESQGEALLPPAFGKVVSGSNAQEISIDVSETEAKVVAGRARATLRVGNPEDYPPAEPELYDDPIPVPGWERMRSVAVAASSDTNRPVLGTVKLEGVDAVSTDSYRLAWAQVTESTDHPEVLIPARAIQGLDVPATKLQIGDRNVRAEVDGGAWWTRLVEGAFPKWRSLLPTDGQVTAQVVVDSDLLASAVKRATSTVEKGIVVTLDIREGEIGVSMKQRDLGDYSEPVAANVSGDPVTVNFHPRYLLDGLGPVDSVTLKVVDDVRPALMVSDWWNYLLMPVRG